MEWFQKIKPRRVTRHTAAAIIVTKNGKTVTVPFPCLMTMLQLIMYLQILL